MGTNTVARTLNDAGLAVWFGGSLMGAVGLRGAAGAVPDPTQRARVNQAGWSTWSPVGAAAIAAHLVGGTLLVPINKGRLLTQRGVAPTSAAQTVCTFGALGATIAARATRRRLAEQPEGEEAERASRRLRLLDAAVPVLTGASFVLNSRLGELQRPIPVAGGIARRLAPWR